MPTDGTSLLLLLHIKPSAAHSVAGRQEWGDNQKKGQIIKQFVLHHKSIYHITPSQRRKEIKSSQRCVSVQPAIPLTHSSSQSGGVLGHGGSWWWIYIKTLQHNKQYQGSPDPMTLSINTTVHCHGCSHATQFIGQRLLAMLLWHTGCSNHLLDWADATFTLCPHLLIICVF